MRRFGIDRTGCPHERGKKQKERAERIHTGPTRNVLRVDQNYETDKSDYDT